MKMHALSSGKMRMKKRLFIPDADREDWFDFPISAWLMRHAQGNVLFDSGCHPSVAEGADERWGPLTRAMQPIMGPDENIISELGTLGLGPDDIDVVVNSHLHCDHCGCNEFFKQATFIVHADELKIAADPASEGNGYFRADWDHPMPLEELEAERDLFDDGRIVLIPLPGHSPGLTTVMANLDKSGSHLLVSDAVSLRANMDDEYIPKNSWDVDKSLASLSEIKRIEAGGATIICGHDADQWATLKKGPEAYD